MTIPAKRWGFRARDSAGPAARAGPSPDSDSSERVGGEGALEGGAAGGDAAVDVGLPGREHRGAVVSAI
jgi:hypothetical protein